MKLFAMNRQIATTVDEPVLMFAEGFGEMEINFKDYYEKAGEKNE